MYTAYINLGNLRVLVQEDLKDVEQTTTQQQQQDYRSSPLTPEEVQWSYTDPQGKVQGKSASSRNKNYFLSFMFLSPSPLEFPIRILILGWMGISGMVLWTDIYTTVILEQVRFPTLKWPTGSVMGTSQWGCLLNEQLMRLSSHWVRNKS